MWFDGWVIPKYAVNTKAASYFINFMCMPENALRNMDAIGYVSAIASAEILEAKIDTTITEYSDLSYFFGPDAENIQIDNLQYPDHKVIERCAMMRDCGNRNKNMLEMWSRVKGDNLDAWVIIVIVVTFGSGITLAIYNKIKEAKRRAKYKKRKSQNKRKTNKKH